MINDFSQIYDSEHDMMHDNIVYINFAIPPSK